jgi:hypothetical protein
MTLLEWIGLAGNIAAIATAVAAACAWAYYRRDLRKKLEALEVYLKSEKSARIDNGERSVLHLMARVGLTEAEVLQASFRSNLIRRLLAKDPKTNRAEAILLVYDDGPSNQV